MYLDLSHKVENKRILLVFSGTFQPNAGMFEYGKAWINLLLRQEWEVGVCGLAAVLSKVDDSCSKFEIPGEYDSGAKYYKVISLSSLINIGSAKRFKQSLLKHIETFKPSVVHIVDRPLYTAYLVNAIETNNRKAITVCTIHDPKRHEEKISAVANLLVTYDDKSIVKQASKSNVLLHVHSQKLVGNTIFEKIDNVIVMPHPLPNTMSKRTRREVADKGSYPIRIGFLGRIEPYKGLDVFYESILSRLTSGEIAPDQIEIVIAGQGHIEQPWERLSCMVEIFNTMLLDQDFHQIIANIDLLVLPYKTATQSGVGMLGLAYGIPVIATNVGALDQLIVDGETGYLIPPEDLEALSEKICDLVDSPLKLKELRGNCLRNLIQSAADEHY